MDNETYLFLAFGISWLVFAVYLWSINSQAQSLTEEVKAIKVEEHPEDR
ncbi:MAG: CcmD family protein [Sphaerobacteraceae bacterium]|nr:MAG: CcmD family protein [Sphaerobacteraceae bacterium]